MIQVSKSENKKFVEKENCILIMRSKNSRWFVLAQLIMKKWTETSFKMSINIVLLG